MARVLVARDGTPCYCKNMTETHAFLYTDEVLKLARISRRTLDRWVEDGRLTATQAVPGGVRRFQRADVEALIFPAKTEDK